MPHAGATNSSAKLIAAASIQGGDDSEVGMGLTRVKLCKVALRPRARWGEVARRWRVAALLAELKRS